MSIEIVYGFVELDNLSHINEEELLVDYGINLYSMEITDGYASKACYGVPCVLNPDASKSAPQMFLSCSDENIRNLLRDEDVEAINKLYTKYSQVKNNSKPIGLQIVYSSDLAFKSQPYSLRALEQDNLKSEINEFEDIYAQARAHIEEQVNAQKRIQEYLQSLQSESIYNFKLTHNLPSKDFLSSGQITIKYEFEIFKQDKLVHHVKIRSNGSYTLADGYNGTTDQVIVISNDNFEPDEDFMGEFESWIYLYSDGTGFQELVSPLEDYIQSLCEKN